MNTCFVIQPFDGDVYDKRYSDVFAPSIKNAGLDPYRVDRDPGVSVPINNIESGIKDAIVCFAEITTDNPNVWFELGYAISASKDVVLVCSEERKAHFPFDVQHRSIIKYRTGAPQDFTELGFKIAERISAILKKQIEIDKVATISPVKDTEGLSQHEIVALVTIMQNQFINDGSVSPWTIKNDMNNAGFTDIAVSLAIKLLLTKNMIEKIVVSDEQGENYKAYLISNKGETWLLENQSRLILQNKLNKASDSDLPF